MKGNMASIKNALFSIDSSLDFLQNRFDMDDDIYDDENADNDDAKK